MHRIKDGYLRVTEVLSPFSGLSKIPEEILKNACIRGTAIHEYADAVIDGLIDNILPENANPNWEGYYKSFLSWECGKKFLTKPGRLYSEDHFICGEVDGIYKDADEVVLFDLKTPLREGKTWNLQLSAYHHLCAVNGIKINRIIAVKLDKKGNYPEVFDYKIDFESYLECLNIYNKFFKDQKENLYLDYL
jgi:hypothetical protein